MHILCMERPIHDTYMFRGSPHTHHEVFLLSPIKRIFFKVILFETILYPFPFYHGMFSPSHVKSLHFSCIKSIHLILEQYYKLISARIVVGGWGEGEIN